MGTTIEPEKLYTRKEIMALLQRANDAGFDLNVGTALESMTIKQLDELLNGKADA